MIGRQKSRDKSTTPSEGSEAFHPRDIEPMGGNDKAANKIKSVMAAFHWSQDT